MRLRRSRCQLEILFILVSYFWMGRTRELSLQHEGFGSTDKEINRRITLHRLSSGDGTIDRCQNFYAHVCGGESNSQQLLPIVLDKKSWHRVLRTRFEELLTTEIKAEDEAAVQKVKRQYKLCMDMDKREEDGIGRLKSLIQNNCDFPMIMACNQWDPLMLRILESQKYEASLFSIRVLNNKIYISNHDVSAYGRFLSDEDIVSPISHPVMYTLKIKQVFEHMGLVNQTTEHSFETDLQAVMEFRSKLHEIAGMKNISHTRVTVAELQRLVSIHQPDWPFLNWESFLQYVFINVTGVEINLNTKVHVAIDYLTALRGLFLQYGPRCIANHIKLHFLETYMPETTVTLRQFSKDLACAAHDSLRQYLRNDSFNPCIHQPYNLRALNYMYLKKSFPKKTRDAALSMVNDLKDSLKDYVKSTKMVSDDNRQWARENINRLNVVLGSERKYSDYNLLDPLFKYEVPDDHLSSVLNGKRSIREYEFSTLNQPLNTTLSGLPILDDRPYVFADKGIIYLPIGYLHRTSLSPTLPGYISYATLGYKISLFLNEVIIKKGFSFRKFSREWKWYDGNPRIFLNKTACITDQYRMQDLKRRSSTDEEFEREYGDMLERYMYDIAAFQTLYPAFRTALNQGRIAMAETSTVTHIEQEFIINWTNRYCIYDKEDKENPSPLRVNNVLRNSNVFHRSFDCSNKTSMNPPNKCIFWD